MEISGYEVHSFTGIDLPIIFHLDLLKKDVPFFIHWHENPELLFFVEGEALVTSDGVQALAKPDDLIVFNSNRMHNIVPVGDYCRYYCLIVEKGFCENFGILTEELEFPLLYKDEETIRIFSEIIREHSQKTDFFEARIKALLIELFVLLARNRNEENLLIAHRKNSQTAMVKAAVKFIKNNYSRHISVDEIAAYTGFSKFYLCREFRNVTGKTVVEYINFVRCSHARELLINGTFNVSQTAEKCGFQNLSYFSKTFKRETGVLPGEILLQNFIP